MGRRKGVKSLQTTTRYRLTDTVGGENGETIGEVDDAASILAVLRDIKREVIAIGGSPDPELAEAVEIVERTFRAPGWSGPHDGLAIRSSRRAIPSENSLGVEILAAKGSRRAPLARLERATPGL
jgi:hypothetical protein